MPCCSKKRKVIEARNLVLQQKSLQTYTMMQGQDSALLNDKLLLDYHNKTHMLYAGAITRKPVNKPFINSTADLHNNFVEEMLKRGTNHNTPLKKI